MMYSRNERWQQIRDYAYGRQNVQKFKKYLQPDAGISYKSIEWPGIKIVRMMVKKMIGRLKNYRMVSRLRKTYTTKKSNP